MYCNVIENNIELLTHLQNTSLGIENHLIIKRQLLSDRQTDRHCYIDRRTQAKELTHTLALAHIYLSLTMATSTIITTTTITSEQQ